MQEYNRHSSIQTHHTFHMNGNRKVGAAEQPSSPGFIAHVLQHQYLIQYAHADLGGQMYTIFTLIRNKKCFLLRIDPY